jgi:DNA replication protein DnaC
MDVLPSHLTANGKKVLEFCRRWAEDPAAVSGPLLMGKSGTYKSHMVWATAHHIYTRVYKAIRTEAQLMIDRAWTAIESGELCSCGRFRVEWEKFPNLDLVVTDGAQVAHDVRSSVEKKNLDEIVARYRQYGKKPKEAVLIIDDVEVMKLSDWLHEELYRIFDYRYQERMPTMLATNLSMEELRQHLGDRIARRIVDMTEPFKL